MKKFLIPLATAIAALLSHENVPAAVGPTNDVLRSVAALDEPKTARPLQDIIMESVAPLVLTKVQLSVHMASHRSHRSHTSHRSHRSGR